MGRSKFPGKPSKHVNRQRVNVLVGAPAPSLDSTKPVVIAESIFIGLSSTLHTAPPPTVDKPRTLNRKRQKVARHVDTAVNLAGKFVLPQRSVHSSRVIKPNKRFVEGAWTRHPVDEVPLATREPSPTAASSAPGTTNRLILRKAKLQLNSAVAPRHPDGPFSAHTDAGGVSPGTVTCGVCGAVRFYRFVKQARKFNIYSCESCRKFISKMIKRQQTKGGKLVCHRGQGVCHVPPIVRSQQWNLIRCAYKARCPACWLKMCLRSFKMPAKLRAGLSELLPTNMQSIENLALDATLGGALPRHSDTTHLQGRTKRAATYLRTRKKEPTKEVPPASSDRALRQKLVVRGPRVKHVCRSASIVLGQPPATFQHLPTTSVESVSETTSTTDQDCDDCQIPVAGNSSSGASNDSDESLSAFRLSRPTPVCSEPLYDAGEIRQHGFGLVLSRGTVPVEHCFLCGSAGREPLLHCSACCEPYHDYCAGAEATSTGWTCSRCAVRCLECNKPAVRTTPCLLCRRLFHTACLAPETSLCSRCEKCAECGATNVGQVVGVRPYCSQCFSRQFAEQRCPHCRQSVDRAGAPVLQCTACRSLWHTVCDSVTSEQLAMLRVLSLHTQQYKCHRCCAAATWRDTLASHFQIGCLAALRSLAELRVAHKNKPPQTTTTTTASVHNPVPEYLKQKFLLRDCSVTLPTLPEHTDRALCDYAKCTCTETLTLLEVKRKVIARDYTSLGEFRHDLELAVRGSGWLELIDQLDVIFRREFPWCVIAPASISAPVCPSELAPSVRSGPVGDACSVCTLDEARSLTNAREDESPEPSLDCYDSRTCALCLCHGDRSDGEGGRLLYCESNTCIHVACALWSVGVHETLDGALLGVAATVRRARLSRCVRCRLRGATIDCSASGCRATFHLPCARRAQCLFIRNYRVFCAEHAFTTAHELTDDDFQVRRSIYVHMDLRAQLRTETECRWQFAVGALLVRHLGTYSPQLSDVDDVIVPAGMACTRMFWSATEPWRVVQYNITTWIASDSNDVYRGDERNFRVDHSAAPLQVEAALNRLLHDSDEDDDDEEESDDEDETDVVCREVLEQVLDAVCECEELPQHAGDILPPEIKDAIFEDLPHDVLDGISMQDIFPKLMSYDDVLSLSESVAEEEPTTARFGRSLKRSKSDVLPLHTSATAAPHQRSCSLTWSCKLNPARKRKISCLAEVELINLVDSRRRILQVDGANADDDDSENDELVEDDSVEAADEPVRCQRCQCTYRTPDSYVRHLAACETMSTSDSESEEEIKNTATVYSNMTVTSTAVQAIPDLPLANHQLAPTNHQHHHHQQQYSNVSELFYSTNMLQTPVLDITQQPIQLDNSTLFHQPAPAPAPTPVATAQPAFQPLFDTAPKYVLSSVDSGQLTLQNPTLITTDTNMFLQEPLKNQLIIQSTNLNPMITLNKKQITTVSPKKVRARTIRRNIAQKPPLESQIQFVQQMTPGTVHLVQQTPPTLFQKQLFVSDFSTPNIQYILAPTISQPTFQPEPLVIGTLLPTGPNLVDCSNLMQTTNLEPMWNPATTPCMYVSAPPAPQPQPTPPVFYGLETVVQNTVMSQQFMSKVGLLAQNSFHTATTQVFQTSTIEPVLSTELQPPPCVIVPAPNVQHYQQPQPAPTVIMSPAPPCSRLSVLPQSNHIQLPIAPVQPARIPTNVVPPTPQLRPAPPPITVVSKPARPTNRVLPMTVSKSPPTTLTTVTTCTTSPTPILGDALEKQAITRLEETLTVIKSSSNSTSTKELVDEQPQISVPPPPPSAPLEPPQCHLLSTPPTPTPPSSPTPPSPSTSPAPTPPTPISLPPPPPVQPVEQPIPSTSPKTEETTMNSLKMVFQKQPEEGVYKISNRKLCDDEKPTIKLAKKKKRKSKNPPSIDPKQRSKLLFKIQSQDGVNLTCTSLTELWQRVVELVQEGRQRHGMPPLPPVIELLSGHEALGLRNQSLRCLLEEMKKMRLAEKQQSADEDEAVESVGGAARCTPFSGQRSDHDMFSWLASRHRTLEFPPQTADADTVSRRASSINLPIAMRYRNLKETSKYSVGVYRSNIHGRGLFCLRDIELGEMVIEYAGELIRSTTTDIREKYYNSKGIGCYMFRIDDNLVVDATVKGNAARFINHSCDPNCYSRVLDILGHKHILIFALRKIQQGEELTYDYKFPYEEEKIPCTCGARRCRKYLN